MHRLAQERGGAEIDKRLQPAPRLDPDQPDHRHGRQPRGRIDLDRDRTFEIAVDEQNVAIGLEAGDVDLGAAFDDLRIFGRDAELGERCFERALPSTSPDDDGGASTFEILQQSRAHECTTFNNGERIALAKRGDDWTRYGSGAIGWRDSSSTSNCPLAAERPIRGVSHA